jgi:protein gp37
MGTKTGIEWTDATWNPIIGCSRVSEGCRNCYAESIAGRFGQWGEWLPAMCDGGETAKDGLTLNCSDAAIRVGKKAAGALLDGREWKEFPAETANEAPGQ